MSCTLPHSPLQPVDHSLLYHPLFSLFEQFSLAARPLRSCLPSMAGGTLTQLSRASSFFFFCGIRYDAIFSIVFLRISVFLEHHLVYHIGLKCRKSPFSVRNPPPSFVVKPTWGSISFTRMWLYRSCFRFPLTASIFELLVFLRVDIRCAPGSFPVPFIFLSASLVKKEFFEVPLFCLFTKSRIPLQ